MPIDILPPFTAFERHPDHDTFTNLVHGDRRQFILWAVEKFPREAYLVEFLTNEETERTHCIIALTDGKDGEVLEYATALISFDRTWTTPLKRKVVLENTRYGFHHLGAAATNLGERVYS